MDYSNGHGRAAVSTETCLGILNVRLNRGRRNEKLVDRDLKSSLDQFKKDKY
jgi:hypothetical protein